MNTTGFSLENYNGTWQSLKYRFFPGAGSRCIIMIHNEMFLFLLFFQTVGQARGLGIYVVISDLVTSLCRKEVQLEEFV